MRWQRVLAVVAATCAVLSAAETPATDPHVPPLFELVPSNFAKTVDGGLLVIAAFVNPALRLSADFHATLHALNGIYNGRDDVLIAYCDVLKNREYMKRFALRELPTVLAFPRGLPAMAPHVVEYSPNRTLQQYVRDINHLIALTNGLESESDALLDAVSAVTHKLTARQEELTAAAARAAAAAAAAAAAKDGEGQGQAAAAEGPEAAAPTATAAASVDASGNTAATDSNTTTVVDRSQWSVAEVQGWYANETAPLLLEVEAEVNATLSLLQARADKLKFALSMLREVSGGDSGVLARRLNVRRREALAGSGMVGVAERDAILRDVGILEDLLTLLQP